MGMNEKNYNPRALHNRKHLNCSFCGVISPSYEESGVSDGAADPIVGPLACGNCYMKLNNPVGISRVDAATAEQLRDMLATEEDAPSNDGLDD